MNIFKKWVSGDFVQVDVITDNLFLDNKQFCVAGTKNLTLAPDGGIYPCQAFYFFGADKISTAYDFDGFSKNGESLLTMCKKCDANNCKKCFYLNKMCTDEKRVPFELHCVKVNLEQRASCRLIGMIENAKLRLPFDINTRIRCSSDLDPLISLRGETFVTKGLNRIL